MTINVKKEPLIFSRNINQPSVKILKASHNLAVHMKIVC